MGGPKISTWPGHASPVQGLRRRGQIRTLFEIRKKETTRKSSKNNRQFLLLPSSCCKAPHIIIESFRALLIGPQGGGREAKTQTQTTVVEVKDEAVTNFPPPNQPALIPLFPKRTGGHNKSELVEESSTKAAPSPGRVVERDLHQMGLIWSGKKGGINYELESLFHMSKRAAAAAAVRDTS